MELQIVNFEQAKALKELGFNYKCQGCYDLVGTLHPYESAVHWNHNACTEHKSCYSAPYLELVAKWLREEKNINIMIDNFDGRMAGFSEVSYMYIMSYIKPIKSLHNCYTMYDTWEQALSAGIDKAIEILKGI